MWTTGSFLVPAWGVVKSGLHVNGVTLLFILYDSTNWAGGFQPEGRLPRVATVGFFWCGVFGPLVEMRSRLALL